MSFISRAWQYVVNWWNGTERKYYSFSKTKKNFDLYYHLCQEIATQSVRLYFMRKISGTTLAEHLHNHKGKLKRCSVDQMALLFPANPDDVKQSTFDFTLLYSIIRNTLTSKPTRGWCSMPSTGDTTEEDDIERIRFTRNRLAHTTVLELNDNDFNQKWTDLSTVIDRLSLGSLSMDVISLFKQDSHFEENEKLENLKQELEKMKGEFDDWKENIHIPANVRQNQSNWLNLWKKDDEIYYDDTHVFQATIQILESRPILTLVGGPGCGKTALARHIALQYEKKKWEVVPVVRFEEILQYANVKRKQLFVIDDIFGIFSVKMELFNNVDQHKECIMSVVGKNTKVLITCRKSVKNEAIKLKSFVLENIVDLESSEVVLSECEKVHILSKHCIYNGVPKKIFSHISLASSTIMFPLLCRVYSKEFTKHESVENFFANPLECLTRELNDLENKSPIQYSALVLCVLNNNKLSLKHMPSDIMKQDAYNTCGVNKGTSDKELENALSYLEGTYLINYEDNFTFMHDAIYEIVAHQYGKSNTHIILKYMNSNFIATRVIVYKKAGADVGTDLSIAINEVHFEQLANRIYKDLQSLELFDVFRNKSLSYPPFRTVFIRSLKKEQYPVLQKILFHEVKAPRSMYTKSNNKNRDEYEEERRQDLLQNLTVDKPNAREWKNSYSIRAISWIIYHGHTHLLQSIIDLVIENNDSTDIVFGSDVTEQTRLLTLGCYSGDHDMVSLILKFIKNDCVKKTSLKETPFTGKFIANPFSFKDFNMHKTYTPFTAACDSGHLSVVQLLLHHNANKIQCDDYGRFPLLQASSKGHLEVVEYLVQNDLAVNQCDKNCESPLHKASRGGHFDVVKFLVQNAANIEQCNIFKESPLHEASMGGHFDIVKYLVENGGNVNQCSKENESPLYKASMGGHFDIVKYLVVNGGNVNQCSNEKESPLYIASKNGHVDVVKYLQEKGAHNNQRNKDNVSLLCIASENGHCSVVEYLIQEGADVNQLNAEKQSPLSKASGKGHKAVVEYLVQNGANVNQCDNYNHSPLHSASYFGHYNVVQYLVQNGVDVNRWNINDNSTLGCASGRGHYNIVKYLVQKGANVNQCDIYSNPPLCEASEEGHYEVIKYLVEKGANVNQCSIYTNSPLYNASKGGYFDIVQYLVQNRADVNQCNKDSESPLYIASKGGHFDVVKCLVEKQVPVNQFNKDSESPLYTASKGGHYVIVQYLVQNGADINQCNKHSESALHDASKGGHFKVVKYLVEKKAHVNLFDKDNKSPIYWASNRGHSAIVEFLVGNGANVNQCSIEKESPLYKASQNGHVDVVKILIENGAHVNQCNKDSQSPLHIASKKGHNDIVQYLVQKEAEVNQCNTYKKTPLYEAVRIGHYDMVKCLIKKYADVTVRTDVDISLLELAVWSNFSEIAKELMRKENQNMSLAGNHRLLQVLIDLRKSGRDGVNTNQYLPTVLVDIICFGKLECLQHLIRLGLNVNQCDNKGNSLLYRLIKYTHGINRNTKVTMLIQNGADVTVRDNNYVSLLEKTRMDLMEEKSKQYMLFFFPEKCQSILTVIKQNIRRYSV